MTSGRRAWLACGLFCGLCGSARVQAAPVRSVVLISIDTLRADRLGRTAASGQAVAPRLDRLGRDGVVFERMISPATWTVPAHASMLTSLYPSFHGAGGAPPQDTLRGIAPEVATLAQVLRTQGMRTQAFYFGVAMSPKFGFAKGFEDYHKDLLAMSLAEEFLGETTFPNASRWVRKHRGERFFLFVHTFAVHRYLEAAAKDRDAWRCPAGGGFVLRDREEAPASGSSCAQVRRRYDRAVHCADEEVGAFLDVLEREGLLDSTLVVVTGDHGEALCDKRSGSLLVGHTYAPYEEQITVPLILRWPGRRFAGRRIAAAVRTIDIMPTVLQALGVPEPAGLQGRSLLPMLESAREPEPEPAFIEHDDWWALRTARYKYMMFLQGGEELYDLQQDPGETHDLAAERPRELADLRGRVRDFRGRARLGWHLAVRGRKGDVFSVRVEADRPLTYQAAFLTEPGDNVRLSPDRKVLTAELACGAPGDEDWISFDIGDNFIGPVEAPALPAASAGEGSLRLSVTRNGKALPPGEFFAGPSALSAPGPLELQAPGLRERCVLDPFAPPAAAAALLWRARDTISGADVSADAGLREALRAAGYLGR